MSIGAPLWLLVALLAAAGLAWIARRHGWGTTRAVLAGAAALLCALAPAEIALRSAAGPVRVVVIDDSGSMRASATNAALRLATPLMSGGARVGVVRFAEIATVARTPSTAPLEFSAEPDRTARRTGVAAALRRAAELLPRAGGEVVLFTDGRIPDSARTELSAAGRLLRARGGKLSVIPAGPDTGAGAAADAAAWSLRGPSLAPLNAAIRLHITAKLSSAGTAHLRVERDGVMIGEGRLDGAPGELQRTVVDDAPHSTAGTVRYRLLVSAGPSPAAPDAIPANGVQELLVTIGRERTVWICADTMMPPGVRELARAAGVRLVPKRPRDMPVQAGALAGVEAVIIAGALRAQFPEGALATLADYVTNGGGLLQLGGPSSFGLAGFGGGPLEQVTAVKADPRTERPLALAIVLDASGSMAEPAAPNDPAAGAKMDAARSAVETALEQLRPADRLYIVPFREGALTPVELGAGSSAEAAAALRAALVPRGGTHIRPAVEAATRWLREATEPARQLLVISDGRDPRLDPGGADRAAMQTLLSALRRDDIGAALLTSESGGGLDALITGVGGRIVRMLQFAGVTQLLDQELRLSRGSLEWTGDAAPAAVTAVEALATPSTLPRVKRANRVALNDGAVELLRLPGQKPGEKPAPLLAVRETGRGRTAAFTSWPTSHWAQGWASGEAGGLLASVLTYVMAADRSADVALRAAAGAESVVVTARWMGAGDRDGRQLDLLDGDRRISFVPQGPGRYQASAPLTATARLVSVVERSASGDRPLGRLALPGGWAAEWAGAGIDLNGCDRLAAAAGGTAVTDALLWRPLSLPGEAPRPIGGWLLGAGLLLVLALFGWRRR